MNTYCRLPLPPSLGITPQVAHGGAVFIASLLLSVLAWAALVGDAFPISYDGEYHVVRVFHLEHELETGQFPVRWSSEQNGGYGYPTFNFYYQFPYYAAVGIHRLGLPVAAAVKLILLTSLIGASVFMTFWSRAIWGSLGGLLAGAVYVLSPYVLQAVYLYVALGEIVVLGLLPAALLTMWLTSRAGPWRWLLMCLTASLLALCVLSHNFLGPLALAFAAAYGVTLALETRRRTEIITAVVAIVLALGLTAYFWVPGLWELRYTSPVWPLDVRFTPRRELLAIALGPVQQDVGVRQVAYVREMLGPPLLTALSLGAVSWVAFRDRLGRGVRVHATFALLLAGLLVLLLVMPGREGFWERVPFLQRAQYGARLILPMALFGGFLAGSVTLWQHWRVPLAVALLALAVLYGVAFARPAFTQHSDDAYFRAHWQRLLGTADGGSPIMPRWAERGAYAPAVAIATVEGAGAVLSASKRSTNIDVSVRLAQPGRVHFTTLYFPGWQAQVDGQPAELEIVPYEGTIAVPVAAGDHVVTLRFVDTPVRRLGNVVSLVTALLMIIAVGVLGIRTCLRRGRETRPSLQSVRV